MLIDDPSTDADVSDCFRRLPQADYLPGWHAQRQGSAVPPAQQDAAAKAAVHAATPTVTHADTLGRPFLTLIHNRFERQGQPVDEVYATRVELDIHGNQHEVIDANDRVVVRCDFDLRGGRIHQASMEAGERWLLADVAGKAIYGWDSRGHRTRTSYDALRRPLEVFLSTNDGVEQLVARTVYGEGLPDAASHNARAKPVQVFDQAGIATNLTSTSRAICCAASASWPRSTIPSSTGRGRRDTRLVAAVTFWRAPLVTKATAAMAKADAGNRPRPSRSI